MLACEVEARRGNESQKERRGGGGVIATDREGGESGQMGDCSHPMRVGVKKSGASRASKVDNGAVCSDSSLENKATV